MTRRGDPGGRWNPLDLSAFATESMLTARRGENLLVIVVIPVAVLLFFASVAILPVDEPVVDFLLPGALALAVIATSLVNLGIATASELDIDSLADRLRTDAVRHQSLVWAPPLIGAFARRPSRR